MLHHIYINRNGTPLTCPWTGVGTVVLSQKSTPVLKGVAHFNKLSTIWFCFVSDTFHVLGPEKLIHEIRLLVSPSPNPPPPDFCPIDSLFWFNGSWKWLVAVSLSVCACTDSVLAK